MGTWKTIPGETPIDPTGLRERGAIRTRAELAAAEAQNIAKAFLKYLAAQPSPRSAPFVFDWLLKLHEEMLGDVWVWAGVVRTRDLNLGVPHHQVREQLAALADDVQSWSGLAHALEEQAVRLHHRAVLIHPFENGNGRWARLLSNVWLKLHGAPIVAWPEPMIGRTSEAREEYLAALQAADGGDDAPLSELHRRFAEVAR